MTVQYLELLPHEFRTRLAARPVGYLPMGTLEWHGEQNALGSSSAIFHSQFQVQMGAGLLFAGLVPGVLDYDPPKMSGTPASLERGTPGTMGQTTTDTHCQN